MRKLSVLMVLILALLVLTSCETTEELSAAYYAAAVCGEENVIITEDDRIFIRTTTEVAPENFDRYSYTLIYSSVEWAPENARNESGKTLKLSISKPDKETGTVSFKVKGESGMEFNYGLQVFLENEWYMLPGETEPYKSITLSSKTYEGTLSLLGGLNGGIPLPGGKYRIVIFSDTAFHSVKFDWQDMQT